MFVCFERIFFSILLVVGLFFVLLLNTLSIFCRENCCRELNCLSKNILSLSFNCSLLEVLLSSSDKSCPLSDVSFISVSELSETNSSKIELNHIDYQYISYQFIIYLLELGNYLENETDLQCQTFQHLHKYYCI